MQCGPTTKHYTTCCSCTIDELRTINLNSDFHLGREGGEAIPEPLRRLRDGAAPPLHDLPHAALLHDLLEARMLLANLARRPRRHAACTSRQCCSPGPSDSY